MVGMWFGEFFSCCCSPLQPKLACSILPTTYKDFFRALYKHKRKLRIPSHSSSILAAACEHKSVLLFDPLTRRRVSSIERAHEDCVNCVRFFDSRTFATCSDDCTVALWDSR